MRRSLPDRKSGPRKRPDQPLLRRRAAHLKRLGRTQQDVSDGPRPAGRWWLAALALLFAMTVAYVLIWSPFVRVDRAAIIGVSPEESVRISGSVDEYLSEPFLRVLPGRSFLLIRPGDLAARLEGRFPEIRSIGVSKRFPRSVEIRIGTRDRFLAVCSGGPCFVVDEEGRIRGSDASVGEDLPIVRLIDTSADPVGSSEPIVSERLAGFLLSFGQDMVRMTGLGLSGDFTTASRASGMVEVSTTEGWKLLLNGDLPSEKTLDALVLLLDRQLGPEDRSRLEYVDLRTENRIYYRFVGDDPEENVTDAAGDQEQPTDGADAKRQAP